jgi:glycosyltransferase involved in cell wall biosynthesis
MGRVEEPVKIELMTRAHVLLFPAVREGWGLSITEANARGTPVVAYDVPGVRDAIVQGKTGLLVRKDDWQAMAQECIALLEDSPRRAALATGALEFARRSSWEETSSQFAAHAGAAVDHFEFIPREHSERDNKKIPNSGLAEEKP